jgi:predicted RNA-binding protein Jag
MIAENTNGKVTLDVEGYRRRVRQEENAQHKMICHQVKSTGRG